MLCMHEMHRGNRVKLHACVYELATYLGMYVSKQLLVAKYARVAPRCRTAWPLCWPRTALRQ
jgi:hypothetical protein